MQNLEIKGKWWLPEKPSNKIYGVLTMTPEDYPTIKLHGSFRESKSRSPFEAEFEKFGIVYGNSSDGKEVTLQDCWISKEEGNLTFEKYTITEMLVKKIFLGNHFSEKLKLKELIVEFPYLSNWMNKRTFNPSFEIGKKVTINLTDWSKECFIEDKKIVFYAGNNIKYSVFKSLYIDTHAFIKIESEDEIPYNQLAKYLWGINGFFNFATGKNTFPCKIKGSMENTDPELKKQGVPKEIEIFFPAKNDYQGKDSGIAQSLPLPLELIETSLDKVLKKWFEKLESLEWVFNLYFSYRSSGKWYLNDEFLAVARALEVYYSCAVKETYLPKEDYKQKVEEPLIKEIKSLNNVDESLKESLKNKLRWGNEKSLYNKLKILYKKKEDSCKQLGISEEFLKKVTNTRNYFTHYTEDKSNILSQEETLKAKIRLNAMLELFILEEIGLSEQEKRFVNYNRCAYELVFQ